MATSTADSKDAGQPVPPVVEQGGMASGGTHAAVKGAVSPRLPHERDESSDSGTREPDALMDKAADDLDDGHVDLPRGPQTQQDYSDLTAAAARPGQKGEPG